MPRKRSGRPRGRPPYPEILTPAEQRVLELLREGMQNAEIGVRLGISPDAVKYHVANMLSKLNLANRSELARWTPSNRRVPWARLAALPLAWKFVAAAGGAAVLAGAAALVALPRNDSRADGFTDGVVSVGYDGSPANGPSTEPVVSGDGRFVAFTSEATNLVPGDTNSVADVFLFDRMTRSTTRVSLTADGEQADGRSSHPSISADGHYVAFESDATNMGWAFSAITPDDAARIQDVLQSPRPGLPMLPAANVALALHNLTSVHSAIYVRDTRADTTELVSRTHAGIAANLGAFAPSISGDGRYVVYSSLATNLVDGDTNLGTVRSPGGCCGDGIAGFGGSDIFLYDRSTGATGRMSVASDGHELAGDAFFGTISADGRQIVFVSDAADVVPGQQALVVNRPPDTTLPVPTAFLRDLKSGAVHQIPVPGDTVWIGQPDIGPDETIVFAAGVSRIHQGNLDSWNNYSFDPSTGRLTALQGTSSSSQFCPRAIGRDAAAWCPSVDGPGGVVWQTKGGGIEHIAPAVPGLNEPHEFDAQPSLSMEGNVLAFIVDGISATSGSDTSIYLVAR